MYEENDVKGMLLIVAEKTSTAGALNEAGFRSWLSTIGIAREIF